MRFLFPSTVSHPLQLIGFSPVSCLLNFSYDILPAISTVFSIISSHTRDIIQVIAALRYCTDIIQVMARGMFSSCLVVTSGSNPFIFTANLCFKYCNIAFTFAAISSRVGLMPVEEWRDLLTDTFKLTILAVPVHGFPLDVHHSNGTAEAFLFVLLL